MTDKAHYKSRKSKQISLLFQIEDGLSVVGIMAWGLLMLKYWFTGELHLLVHPRYFWVVLVTSAFLLFIAAFKAWSILHKYEKPKVQHFSLLPTKLTSGLFLLVALLGFLMPLEPLNSQAAIQQGLPDTLISTRVTPQTFRTFTRSEDRSLYDWIKTLAVYPEPDSFTGQKAKLRGFVVHSDKLPNEYFILTRFVIAHCALDAFPVGLPVQLTESRQAYPPDMWLEIDGQMVTAELAGSRQLTIQAQSIQPIPAPKNPYEY